jgi:hypothetical protein
VELVPTNVPADATVKLPLVPISEPIVALSILALSNANVPALKLVATTFPKLPVLAYIAPETPTLGKTNEPVVILFETALSKMTML